MVGRFAYECFRDQETGRIIKKIEKSGSSYKEYEYCYDDAGRLVDVFCNDLLSERYVYNASGQRIRRLNGWADGTIRYGYDKRGCCLVAGDRFYDYDEEGNLTHIRSPAGEMRLQYKNTLLRKVVLPDGTNIVYFYNDKGNNPVGPVEKYVNGELAMKYDWRDIQFLKSCSDYTSGIRYHFSYDGGKLVSVWLGDINGEKRLFLQARCDQVGTPKLFLTGDGQHVKELAYDSFGVLEDDTNPDLAIPIGFAGGLLDANTGLVRFGFRDYDPHMGRFTCPDPLGDTGGDHDLYDYCVDDPINLNDPSGLFPPLFMFLGGKALALGIAAAGTYGSAYVVDKIKSYREGKESTVTRDAMNTVAPKVGLSSGAGALPGATVMAAPMVASVASGAVTAANKIAGRILYSRYGEKIMTGGTQFIDGLVNPNPPTQITVPGIVGAATAYGLKEGEKIIKGNR